VQRALALAATVLLGGALGCSAPPPSDDGIRIGLMLSYSGYLAANSVNSERALIMAVDAANAAGGVGGQPIRLIPKDTRSSGSKVLQSARELLDEGVAVFIGPDTTDLVTQLRTLLQGRTILLPSYATASDVEYKPQSWFVMGAGISRVCCELVSQLRADGRKNPVAIVNPTGYTSGASWELGNTYAMPKVILPIDRSSTAMNIEPVTSVSADSYVLAAFPASASSLIYALAAAGKLGDARRWYLFPTLHTPAFVETIPKGALDGVRGVSPGTVAGAAEFRTKFAERWQDAPLDDAYPFYDAGAIAVLALGRAMAREGAIPEGAGLSEHIVKVTHAGGMRVQWNEIDRGLQLLGEGKEIEYIGLSSGAIEFDLSGQTEAAATTNWWTIGPDGFEDVPHASNCK
jgi:ABC-type branched-subunit amino acid transport system substrate-binding protein